jgi:hypothetical protein
VNGSPHKFVWQVETEMGIRPNTALRQIEKRDNRQTDRETDTKQSFLLMYCNGIVKNNKPISDYDDFRF